MKIIVIGGMTLTVAVIETLCKIGVHPIAAVGYPIKFESRSNYESLQNAAKRYKIPLLESEDINGSAVKTFISRFSVDWLVVAGWSQLLRKEILDIPLFGTLGFHMSKLPEGRGRAPVAWTLIKNRKLAWVTLQWLSSGVDDGDIALQASTTVNVFDDASSVVKKVNSLSADMIRTAVPLMRLGELPRNPQDGKRATYWPIRRPADGRIDWQLDAKVLYDFIRGITYPFPGAFFIFQGEKFKVINCGFISAIVHTICGSVVNFYIAHGEDKRDFGIVVSVNSGFIILRELENEEGVRFKGFQLKQITKTWIGQVLQ